LKEKIEERIKTIERHSIDQITKLKQEIEKSKLEITQKTRDLEKS
jgi:chromosome segregation ATPase